MRLSPFNSLPAKPEHILMVRRALKPQKEFSVSELIMATGLTKTQLLCSLEELIKSGEAVRNLETKKFGAISLQDSKTTLSGGNAPIKK